MSFIHNTETATGHSPQGESATPRIALLVSGGVDSAVAAHLLCEQGHRPDLFYIRIGPDGGEWNCSMEEDVELSQALARQYGLHLEIVNLQHEYEARVTAYVIDRLRRGLTPNPDILCNKFIKFGAFEEVAGHQYDKVATGHYARILHENGGIWLGTSPDFVKDQTDFLSQLGGNVLSKTEFPIGHLTKQDVRRVAETQKLPSAHRRDSQGICFLGKINYTDYMRKLLGRNEGDLVEKETGRIVGRHGGYWTLTIGQRKGIGLSGGPWYVTDKDVEHNIIYVSHLNVAGTDGGRKFGIKDFHFVTGDPWNGAAEADILFKIRHTERPQPGRFTRTPDGDFRIKSSAPLQGIAPGQFSVLYTIDGRICAGSGEIRF